jgi:hypothetical protein
MINPGAIDFRDVWELFQDHRREVVAVLEDEDASHEEVLAIAEAELKWVGLLACHHPDGASADFWFASWLNLDATVTKHRRLRDEDRRANQRPS